MTRSIGDTVLSDSGVVPVPEVSFIRLSSEDTFIVLASDGVWEFMTSQEVADLVGKLRRDGVSAEVGSTTFYPARRSHLILLRYAADLWPRDIVMR